MNITKQKLLNIINDFLPFVNPAVAFLYVEKIKTNFIQIQFYHKMKDSSNMILIFTDRQFVMTLKISSSLLDYPFL